MAIKILKDLRKDFKLENYKITEEDIKNYPDYNFKPFEKNDINDENADSSDSSEEDKNFYNGEKLVISSSSMDEEDTIVMYKFTKDKELIPFTDFLIYQKLLDSAIILNFDKIFIAISYFFDEEVFNLEKTDEIQDGFHVPSLLLYDAFVYNTLTPQGELFVKDEDIKKIEKNDDNRFLNFTQIFSVTDKNENSKVLGFLENGYLVSWSMLSQFSDSIEKIVFSDNTSPEKMEIDTENKLMVFTNDKKILICEFEFQEELTLKNKIEIKNDEVEDQISHSKVFKYNGEIYIFLGYESGKFTIKDTNGNKIFEDSKNFKENIVEIDLILNENFLNILVASYDGTIGIFSLNEKKDVNLVISKKKNMELVNCKFIDENNVLFSDLNGEALNFSFNQ